MLIVRTGTFTTSVGCLKGQEPTKSYKEREEIRLASSLGQHPGEGKLWAGNVPSFEEIAQEPEKVKNYLAGSGLNKLLFFPPSLL